MNPSSPSESGYSLPDEPHLSTTPSTVHPPRRQSSGRSGWEQSPIISHHNQGTSYFPAQPNRPISPAPLPRRHIQTGTSMHSRFTRSASNSSMRNNRRSEAGRSASISSTRPIRDDRGAFSEDEEDEIEQREAEEVGADGGVEADRNSPDTPSEGAIVDEALSESGSLDPVTLRERQSLINVEHPFGLPIWKPALYKKSRSVTRNAETALHSVPSASAEKHFLPGNLVWVLMFGWWLAAIIIVTSAVLYVAEFISRFGAHTYSTLVYGLGWYVFWPFGNYLEGDLLEGEDPPVKRNSLAEEVEPEEDEEGQRRERGGSSGSGGTVRGVSPPTSPPLGPSPVTDERRAVPLTSQSTITPRSVAISSQHQHVQSSSWNSTGAQPPDTIPPTERTSLLSDGSARAPLPTSIKFYGTTTSEASPIVRAIPQDIPFFASLSYWLILILVIAPIMLTVTILCWGLVVTIPMAKLNWALLKFLFLRPLSVRFRAAPLNVIVQSSTPFNVANGEPGEATEDNTRTFTFKSPRLRAGQAAPTRKGTGGSDSTVLLCIYRATGSQYYKYTVGGVNILFINLLPIVFFAIFDGFFLLPIVEHRKEHGRPVTPLLSFIAHRATIFILSLSSVIPLSYFIGMAVASISAQSSIGMGAVINATFGSVIEILLYAIALTRGKGRLVEGSIVGSILAGVLLMPGASMCSGALKKKEQKFNAKSAGVTSTMLIMAIIGVLTPTLFYQTYGNFQLVCEGCPDLPTGLPGDHWMCKHCYYTHPDPTEDPFYQTTVKALMYFCAGVLLLSYLIGLWFSLRTHASQIWQNPQQLMHPLDAVPVSSNPAGRSLYNRIVSSQMTPLPSHLTASHRGIKRQRSNLTATGSIGGGNHPPQQPSVPSSPTQTRRISYAPVPHGSAAQAPPFTSNVPLPTPYTTILESVDTAVKNTTIPNMQLPPNFTTEDFSRAVAVATVSALRHQVEPRGKVEGHDDGDAAGHEGPSWSRTTSASVLLACTALYAVIAEILVDVVDVVLEGSGIDEKFLGITLFALVPNTTEFMNAMSFAINGNIALSMEIGSAYALQVCLLQIPAMVAFSAYYDPRHIGSIADTFTLIFPRWDVIAIILSIFLLTYTYIEAKSNYHRGSILILSYVVLTAGFYLAPRKDENSTDVIIPWLQFISNSLSLSQSFRLAFQSLWSR